MPSGAFLGPNRILAIFSVNSSITMLNGVELSGSPCLMPLFTVAVSEPIAVVVLEYMSCIRCSSHSGRPNLFIHLAIELWLTLSKAFSKSIVITDKDLAFFLACLKARSKVRHPIAVPSNFWNPSWAGFRVMLLVTFALNILFRRRIHSDVTVMGLNSSGFSAFWVFGISVVLPHFHSAGILFSIKQAFSTMSMLLMGIAFKSFSLTPSLSGAVFLSNVFSSLVTSSALIALFIWQHCFGSYFLLSGIDSVPKILFQ